MSSSQAAQTRALPFIFFTVLLDAIGVGLILPILPRLIAGLEGASLSEAASWGGWLAFTFGIVQFLAAPLVGNLSDTYGRRPLLLLSLLGFGLDYVFQAFAPGIGWLFVGRALAGFTGASYTVASAYVADISPAEKRSQNFGVINGAFGVGFVIGPVLGGLLVQYGTQIPFLLAASLSLLNAVYGYFVLPESLPVENRRPFSWARANPIGSLAQVARFPQVKWLLVAWLLWNFAGHSMESAWVYFTMLKFQWDEFTVGLSLATFGIIMAAAQMLLAPVILPKLGDRMGTYLGMAISCVCYLLFAVVPYSWMLFVLFVPDALSSVGVSALQGLMSNKVPEDEQGELQGTITSLVAVVGIPAPIVMTSLFAYFSSDAAPVYQPGAPFIVGSVLISIGMVIAYRALRKAVRP